MLMRIFSAVCLLLLVFCAVAFATGWIQVRAQDNSTTIELKTTEMKEAAEDLVQKSKEFINQVDDQFQGHHDGNDDGQNKKADKG